MSHYLAVSYIVTLFLLSTIPGIARAADSTTPSASPSASPSPTELTRSAPKNSCKDQPVCIDMIKKGKDLEQNNRDEEALSIYKIAYEQFDDQRILIRVGVIQNRMSRYSDAMKSLSEYIYSGIDHDNSQLMKSAKIALNEALVKKQRDVMVTVYQDGPGVIKLGSNQYQCATKPCELLLHYTLASPMALTSLIAKPESSASTVSWSAPCKTTRESPGVCTLSVDKSTDVHVAFKRSRARIALGAALGIGAAVAFVTGSAFIAKPELGYSTAGFGVLGGGSVLGALSALSLSLALK